MKAVIFGMGVSGRAAAKFLTNQNYSVYVFDDNGIALKEIISSEGYFTYSPEANYDIAVISPGIPSEHQTVKNEIEKGTEVIGDLELAGRFLENEKIVAVTGTNGKSTTVSLISDILNEAGYRTFLCGNIGTSVLEAVGKGYEFVVIEVSSFQLETLSSINPDVSVILNVSPDHLDRYDSYEEYLLTKVKLAGLTKADGILVINGGDEPLVAACTNIPVKKQYFSWKDNSEFSYRNGVIYCGNSEILVADTKLKGTHNVENIMAAIISVSPWIKDIGIIKKVLAEFEPLPHRTQFVAEIKNVAFINDSKGTNVGATEKSLTGYKEHEVVLILGGVDKGGSYELLRELADKKCKGIVLIGEAAQVIKPYFEGFYPVIECFSMSEAVESAYQIASGEGTVLFSPACSSFDWYRNYKERGDDFINKVLELKKRENND